MHKYFVLIENLKKSIPSPNPLSVYSGFWYILPISLLLTAWSFYLSPSFDGNFQLRRTNRRIQAYKQGVQKDELDLYGVFMMATWDWLERRLTDVSAPWNRRGQITHLEKYLCKHVGCSAKTRVHISLTLLKTCNNRGDPLRKNSSYLDSVWDLKLCLQK